jgi:site-specific DNA recombinase
VADSDPATTTPDAMMAAPTTKTLAVPWTVPATAPARGIVHVPAHNTPMKPGSRETLLVAIAKARRWAKEAAHGESFAQIAHREGKAERYIRHLVPLAFVSPRIITAIIDGTIPAAITATTLAGSLRYSWAEQERRCAQLC